jgi:dTDP-4-amino-4,6-dideoxygalactose transaminase
MSQANFIPHRRQSIPEANIQALLDVLCSDFLLQGAVEPAFEQAVASYCHARHGFTASKATAALEKKLVAAKLRGKLTEVVKRVAGAGL